MSLLASTVDLFLRRLTHTASRPRLRAPLYAGILLIGTVASVLLSISGYRGARESSATEASFSNLIALAVAFVTAGPVILLVDGARDRSRQFQRCLASLPLSGRQLSALVWGPPALFGAVVIAWLTPPTLFTLLGSGMAPAEALTFTLLPLGLGAAVALLALTCSTLVLRGARWDVVRPPVAYLLWVALVVVEFVASFDSLQRRDDALVPWLLFPKIASALANGRDVEPIVMVISAGLIAGSVALAWMGSRERAGAPRQRSVRLAWRGRSRLLGELVYLLRDPSTMANILSAAVLCWVAALLMNRLPPELQHTGFRAAATLVCLCAAVPCRGIRGIHTTRAPAAQLLGMSAVGWVSRQIVAAAAVFVGVSLPLWFLPGIGAARSVALAVAVALSALACAVFVGAILVVRPDNSLGQVLGAIAVIAVGGAVEWLIGDLPPLIALASGAAALLVAAGSAIALELARWNYRSGHHPAH